MQEQESLALDQLFLCTNGPQWKNKTGWTKEDNKAMLHGVTFNNVHGGITILSLSGNNLAGETAVVLAMTSAHNRECLKLMPMGKIVTDTVPIKRLCPIRRM